MSSVLQNLRQRKIVQWALAYLAAAWIVLQVITLVAGNFGWPPVVPRATTILLVLGLPVTLLLAWYHGEKGHQRVSGLEALMIAAFVVVAGVAVALVSGREEKPDSDGRPASAGQVPDKHSIAVLPFTNLSGDPEQEFFSDGMTEEIINHLAKVQRLKVISRTSVMRYKDTPRSLREIAGELEVATILEGSVRREGNRVRVTAQLIDAASDAHLWSETYDREVESVFAIQSDVATSIVRALALELTADERRRIEQVPTASQAAYQLYLRGRYFWNRRTLQDLERALELFQQATQADPDFALAHVGIAEAYLLLPQYGPYPREEARRLAEEAANRALELDPSSGEAYATLGALAHGRWEWERAEELFSRAVALSPGYATGHQWYAEYLCATGRIRRAVEEAERARALDPQSMIINTIMSTAYRHARRYDDAIAAGRAASEMTDDVVNPYGALALALQEAGRFDEAMEALSTVAGIVGGPEAEAAMRSRFAQAWRERGERGYWETTLELYDMMRGGPDVYVAMSLLRLGDREAALARLEQGVEEGTMGEGGDLIYNPGLDALRDEPRFRRLAARMGLPARAPAE